MNGINEVVKHNSKWLKTAEAMCGDYDLAQDLVQDMYINLMEKEVINEALVCITLNNLWLGTFRYKKTHDTFSIDSEEFAGELQSTESEFEIEDHQLKYIKRFNELPYRQQEDCLRGNLRAHTSVGDSQLLYQSKNRVSTADERSNDAICDENRINQRINRRL